MRVDTLLTYFEALNAAKPSMSQSEYKAKLTAAVENFEADAIEKGYTRGINDIIKSLKNDKR